LRPEQILGENPELRLVGIAEAYRYAAENRARYEDFFEPDGSLQGPGFSPEAAAGFPEHLRSLRGVVVTERAGAPV
ncbi:MAG: hypothetical protein M3301_01135, partial [Chloroflexota bacterium]|nr:hypothetical protein [Chloroflexota bacterium]